MEWKKGDQLIYLPPHTKGNEFHVDAEEGFFVSFGRDPDHAFCRFFSNFNGDLRTTANSELTPLRCVRRKDHRSQDVIDWCIERYKI